MKLRPYQEDQLQALWSYFMHHKGNPVIAAPCGTGKSLVPAEFIRRTLHSFPNEKFLVVTHVKELIAQDYSKMIEIWPEAPVGIYSAGLKRKEIFNPIIFGGIQSMHRHPDYFGWRDLLFIDEAHLVSQDEASMYLTFIAKLRAINPNLKVIGLSATPYRMGQGYITDGGLFTDIVHDLTSLDNYNKLIQDGYICKHVAPSRLSVRLDVSNVGMQKGEFIQSQLQHEVDKAEITWKALQETCYYGQSRRSWLIFASGIQHAEHIAEMLTKLGIDCAAIHSKKDADYNDKAIKAFKNYELRSIVNYGKLTTGFDHPGIDLIEDLRPTLSIPLHVQKLGRGGRIEYQKDSCLVLDHAGNVPNLGPINDPCIPRKKGDKVGQLPIKICEACGVYNHIKAIKCDGCGKPFEFKVKIVERAGTEEVLRQTEAPIIETFDVNYVTYSKKQKTDKTGKSKAPYIQANYFCGLNMFKEFQFPENKGFRKPFVDWWRQRSKVEPPATTEECVNHISQLRAPRRIRVHVNRMVNGRNYPEVLSVEF
jgi:DNA repair protein RadD